MQDEVQEGIQNLEGPEAEATDQRDNANSQNNPAQDAGTTASQPETIPNMQEMLKKAELLAQEHHDAWMRARAEADNIRKRAQIDVSNAHKYAVENFSTALLSVKDSLEAALAAENSTPENLRSGVELTLKQLISVFEKFNISEINPAPGEKFDPHKHQAIGMVESDLPSNTVVQVMQKGYQLTDRVIRPAMVTVSRARAA